VTDSPEPPIQLPGGCVVHLPGRGETFIRDTGGDGPPVLLLHGWMASADLNWATVFDGLAEAGYRAIAIDHRGHGRGLRSPDPFSLSDCADDAAALLRELDCGPAVAVGYSMGGPVAQLLARDHPDAVRGIVLCATAMHWQEPRLKWFWRGMAVLRLFLGLFPNAAWRWGLRRLGMPDNPVTSWIASELSRSSARDVAEAGRELGRFDSRPWIASVRVPAAVVATRRDEEVPLAKQRALAEALGAQSFDVDADHMAVGRPDLFMPALLGALEAVRASADKPSVSAVAG
jgi:3-oxoadipate enol-lactonase